MAIPTSIKTLLSGDVVEWARIELKQTWDPAASLKTIWAFANDLDNWGGGYIIIGVQEVNGRPIYPLKGVQPEKLDSFQKSIFLNCKMKLELRNWDKGACPFIPIRAVAGPLFSISV